MRHFSVSPLLCAAAALLGVSGAALAQAPSSAYGALPTSNQYSSKIFPVSRAIPSPTVIVDTTAAPECADWAQEAKLLVEQWFPIVSQFLDTENYNPPAQLRLIFRPADPAHDFVAGTSGSVITINSKYVMGHQSDFGMVIHEMTHVIQGYPDAGDKPGWIVEGMADYVRYYRYEPDTLRNARYYANTTDYHHGYEEAAAFLAWIAAKYDRRVIFEVDGALRTGAYSPEFWKTYTGKSLDDLWGEYLKTLPTRNK
jgi:hypothetical protein